VLLKNENSLLPLGKDIKSIAVIGPLADNQEDLLGCWWAMGRSEDVVPILAAVKDKIPAECKLRYAKGCDIDGSSMAGFSEAVKAALQSEVVVLVVGESRAMSGEAHSRASLELPGVQQKLVETIHATGKLIVVVLVCGRPLSISWVKENIPAVLLAWQGGVQAGSAVADCLFGDYNPSGRLTTSFPRTVGQVPIYYNHKNTGRPPGSGVHTSRYLDIATGPLFVFGYGLSYTKFEYGNLSVSQSEISLGGSVTVKADVTNTGNQRGEETVQLYIRDLVGSVTRPVKELRAFKKISLEPGETKTVSLAVGPSELSFYDLNMNYVVEPGESKVWVGPNCMEGLEGQFVVIDK
jgi:beta-glucosidase